LLRVFSQAKERVKSLVQSGVESGAKLLLEGRNIVVAIIPLNAFFNCLIITLNEYISLFNNLAKVPRLSR
jgi:hypothetical protein